MARNPAKAAKPRAAKKAAPKPASAKKAAKAAAAKPGTRKVTKAEIDAAAQKGAEANQTVTKLPAAKFLNDFVKTILPGFEADMVSSRGDIGSAIANAMDKHHVEKRALSIVRRLHKMPDKKFAETFEHLMDYMEKLGFQKRYDDMPKLALSNSGPKEGDEDETSTEQADDGAPKMKIVDEPGADAKPESLADAMHDHLQRDEANKPATTH